MKMLRVLTLFSFGIFISVNAFSAPVGNAEITELRKIDVGVEYNHLFNKDVMPERERAYDSMNIDSSSQVSALISTGLFKSERFAVDASIRLGAANLSTDSTDRTFFKKETLEYGMGFLWGARGRVAYKNPEGIQFSLHGQYNQFDSDLDEITYDGEKGYNISGPGTKARVQEFQAAILMSVPVEPAGYKVKLVPYVGPTFNWMQVETGTLNYETDSFTSGTNTSIDSGRDDFGVAIGLTILTLREALALNIEARFINEQALTLSIHYKF